MGHEELSVVSGKLKWSGVDGTREIECWWVVN